LRSLRKTLRLIFAVKFHLLVIPFAVFAEDFAYFAV
jgi:hypothetical protein